MCDFFDIHTHTVKVKENVFSVYNVSCNDTSYDGVFSVGIHPWNIGENWKSDFLYVKEKAQDFRCLAIGECGFDKTIGVSKELQKQVFKRHVCLANELCKPLIVHCVGAFDIIQQFYRDINQPLIVHDFGRNATLGLQLQQLGIYLSLGKALFRPHFSLVLQSLNIEYVVLETDDTNYSIEDVYEKASELLSWDISLLKKQMNKNFKNIFK